MKNKGKANLLCLLCLFPSVIIDSKDCPPPNSCRCKQGNKATGSIYCNISKMKCIEYGEKIIIASLAAIMQPSFFVLNFSSGKTCRFFFIPMFTELPRSRRLVWR